MRTSTGLLATMRGRTLRSIRSRPCASGLALRPKRLFGFDGTADEDPRFSTGLLSLRGLGPSSATATALLSPAVLIKLQGAPSLGRRRELVRPHAERLQHVRPEGIDERDVRCVPADGDLDASDPRLVVARVERVPSPADVSLEPGAEVHRGGIGRHADIAEIAVHVARRNVHAPAKADRQMSEITADAGALGIGFERSPGRPCVLVSERNVAVDEVADRLQDRKST